MSKVHIEKLKDIIGKHFNNKNQLLKILYISKTISYESAKLADSHRKLL